MHVRARCARPSRTAPPAWWSAWRITGYTTKINYFAHSVAETNDDLRALICEADDFGTPGFLVPLANNDLFRWCLDQGLRIFFVTNMMTIGLYQEPEGAYMPVRRLLSGR